MNHTNRWTPWYAWRPVIVDHEGDTFLVWFEDVVRRRVWSNGRYRWQYALHEGCAGF